MEYGHRYIRYGYTLGITTYFHQKKKKKKKCGR